MTRRLLQAAQEPPAAVAATWNQEGSTQHSFGKNPKRKLPYKLCHWAKWQSFVQLGNSGGARLSRENSGVALPGNSGSGDLAAKSKALSLRSWEGFCRRSRHDQVFRSL